MANDSAPPPTPITAEQLRTAANEGLSIAKHRWVEQEVRDTLRVILLAADALDDVTRARDEALTQVNYWKLVGVDITRKLEAEITSLRSSLAQCELQVAQALEFRDVADNQRLAVEQRAQEMREERDAMNEEPDVIHALLTDVSGANATITHYLWLLISE